MIFQLVLLAVLLANVAGLAVWVVGNTSDQEGEGDGSSG